MDFDVPLFFSMNFKPQTPQGDGNRLPYRSHDGFWQRFQTTNPARGRKQLIKAALLRPSHLFQTTNPARGRKLTCRMTQAICSFVEFQTTNPARGRKPTAFFNIRFICIISNHKPRKGTETDGKPLVNQKPDKHFKPQTPQGDGNPLRTSPDLSCAVKISNHKPRKGTETQDV